MAISFYDASVAGYLQTLGAVIGLMDKGLAYARGKNIDPQSIVETRLHPDMLPFSFQIHSVGHHSLGAIEGMKAGVFRPPGELPAKDYAGLQKYMSDVRASLQKLTPDEVNALEGRDLVFEVRGMKLPFTTKDFLTSFSLPNFYFHATTAYDILRCKDVPIGKRDYMGELRMKR